MSEVPVEVTDPVGESGDDGQLLQGLSWGARIQLYALLTALAFFSTAMGWVAMGIGYYWKYSVLSTLGSLMSLAGTCVIMGPRAQFRCMFDEYRCTSAILYICSLFLTLFVAFMYKSLFLCFICGLFQYGCLIWYSLSYVPYAQEAVSTFLRRAIF